MNVFFFTSSSNLSGGSRQALYTAQGLAERGHKLTFFAPHDAQLPQLDPTLLWQRLPQKRSHWGSAIAAKLPPAGTPFVLHAFHNKAVKLAAWRGLFWRRKSAVVLAQRGVVYKPNNPLPYWSPGIDCFIANSRACANVLQAKGVGSHRLRVVYNGIPAERITPVRPPNAVRDDLSLTRGDFIFCCVANDSANKGAAVLLQALAQAKLTGVKLIMLGVTPEQFTPLVRELGISEQVRLPGRTEHVADYLQISQAFVLPSLSESMPNTLQEAVCMGLPVIASQAGGVPECVQGNGLLVPPGDVAELAQALQRFARDHESLKQWGAASVELAPVFSMQRKLDEVEAIYRHCLQRRNLLREPWV